MDRIYNMLLATGIPQLNEKIKEIQNFNILNTVSSKSELESENLFFLEFMIYVFLKILLLI